MTAPVAARTRQLAARAASSAADELALVRARAARRRRRTRRGSSRSSSAPTAARRQRARALAQCSALPHRVAVGLDAEPALERERALLDQHRQRRRPRDARASRAARTHGVSPRAVDEIEHGGAGREQLDVARGTRRRAGRPASRSRRASRRRAPRRATTRRRTDAPKRAASARARSMLRLYTRTRAEPPSFDRGQHRRRAAAGAEQRDASPIARASPSSARAIASEAADVGVVADERAVLVPERVHRADALRERVSARTQRGDALLVRDRHVARGALAPRAPRASSSSASGATSSASYDERDVRPRAARRSGSAARASARPDARAAPAARAVASRRAGHALRGEPVEHAPDLASRARRRSRDRRRARRPSGSLIARPIAPRDAIRRQQVAPCPRRRAPRRARGGAVPW